MGVQGYHADYDAKLARLVGSELPPEQWSFSGRSDLGILRNYLFYTFEKLREEQDSAPDEEKGFYLYEGTQEACFDTGLIDKNLQSVYFYCRINPRPGQQKWEFHGFHNSSTIKYTDMPAAAIDALRRPDYFSEPAKLIFNVNLPIVPQWQHILENPENFLRIPEQIRGFGKEFCRNAIGGEIENLKRRIAANYKIVVPQWYKGEDRTGEIQLLVPLHLGSPQPTLALAVSLSRDGSRYEGHTCLTFEMAYNNARLIARPESSWLVP
jgi:hypothetical protein